MAVAAQVDHTELRNLTLKGAAVLVLFAGLVGGWSVSVPITGAVVASGQLVIDHNVRKVQHPTGGVVGEILARDGDSVKAGDVLVRLDETVIRANLTGVSKKIDELEARAARLNAERMGYKEFIFPKSLLERKADVDVAEILSTERALYDARRTSHKLRKQRMEERVQQLHQEVESAKADLKAKRDMAVITEKELKNLRSLDRLVTAQRLNAVERDSISLGGQQSQLLATIAQSQGKIVETKMQSESLDDELRAETTKDLREAQAELAQQIEKKAAALDQLKRIDIRAPISGRVHQSIVHTVGGVVTAADPMMQIVPTSEALELEARVAPQDIDQIYVGQTSHVRLSAFNRRTTPDIVGEVVRISADVTKEQQTGVVYYGVRVSLPRQSVEAAGLTLQAGMQAEALIQTAERTPLEYLTKPLLEQMRRAFRER